MKSNDDEHILDPKTKTPTQLDCDSESNQNRNQILNYVDDPTEEAMVTKYRNNFRHLSARYRSEPNLNQISMKNEISTMNICSTPRYQNFAEENRPLTAGISFDNLNAVNLKQAPFVFHDHEDICDDLMIQTLKQHQAVKMNIVGKIIIIISMIH